MKCSKCGKEVNKEDKFCSDCGQVLDGQIEKVEEESNKEETIKVEEVEEKRIISSIKNDTFFCLISIACYILGPVLIKVFGVLKEYSNIFGILSKICGIFPFAAYGLAIYAKVKYPKSQFAKVLLIIYIVLFVFAIIAIIIFIVACYLILRDCRDSNFIMNLIF